MKFFKNTKKQGDMGLGVAIGYFTGIGQTVGIPLTDSQDYDLIVDNGKDLSRVQIKTTSYKRINYEVNLSVKGGNRTSVGKIKKFDTHQCDYLFVVTEKFDRYLIPSQKIVARQCLALGPKYDKYKV
jgi:hypothetical protein